MRTLLVCELSVVRAIPPMTDNAAPWMGHPHCCKHEEGQLQILSTRLLVQDAAEELFVSTLIVAVGGKWLGRSARGHTGQSVQIGENLFPVIGILLGRDGQIEI